VGDRLGIEQVAQAESVAAPEQLGEQRRVQREGGGAALGQRGVALVDELRDVAEGEGPCERRRDGGLDVDHGHLARADPAHEVGEARHVEDVLDALAHGFEDDRERGVLARDLEQLRGALALLPEGLPLTGTAAREEQGAGRALAKTRRKEG